MSTLDELATEALAIVREHGVAPTTAAEKVVSLDRLDSNDLLYCAQRYVGTLVHTQMTQERRVARRTTGTPRRRGVRENKVTQLVSVMENTMSNAVAILLTQNQGADGVERALCDFSIEDHRYRLNLESKIEDGARTRKMFHTMSIETLQAHDTLTIADLPMAEQFELGRVLNG